MKLRKILVCVSLVSLCLGFVSCDDGDDDTSTTSTTSGTTANGITFTQVGSLVFDIKHTFGTSPLTLAPASYVTMAKDTIRVTELNYYISNIVLTSVNGNKVALEGYFLQKFLPNKTYSITLKNVPAGTYKTISYLVGVDSLANSTQQHTGDLDPMNGMYWVWETGYIFVRIVGRHSETNKSFGFDIGGTQNGMAVHNELLSYKLAGANISVALQFDLEKVFNAPDIYDLKIDSNFIHADNAPGIDKLVPNIKNAFSITSIH